MPAGLSVSCQEGVFVVIAFLLVNSDQTTWVVTYEDENEMRKRYPLHTWLSGDDADMEGAAVGTWLEEAGSSIELVYPIDLEKKTVSLSDDDVMEYTELLDDVRLFG